MLRSFTNEFLVYMRQNLALTMLHIAISSIFYEYFFCQCYKSLLALICISCFEVGLDYKILCFITGYLLLRVFLFVDASFDKIRRLLVWTARKHRFGHSKF